MGLIWRELGRFGMCEDGLPPYQRDIFHDLQEPLDEWALSKMLEYWSYNLELLFGRRRGWEPKHVPAKPRIDVVIEMTSKGNLKAEWFPRGWNIHGAQLGGPVGSDFIYWHRYDHRFQAYDSRPSNELFFIHGVARAVDHIDRDEAESPYRPLDHVLLCACANVVDELKARLEPRFDVRMVSDLYLEWTARPGRFRSEWDEPEMIVGWVIEDPDKRRIRNELAELSEMQREFGTSREQLVECWTAEAGRKKGAAAGTGAFTARVQKAIKAGGGTTTPKQLTRLLELIEAHDQILTAQLKEIGKVHP